MGDRVYVIAGQVLEKVLNKRGTVKSLCLSQEDRFKKVLFALVSETVKYLDFLEVIVQSSGVLEEKLLTKYTALILSYDLFIGNGINSKRGRVIDVFLRHRTRILAEAAKLKVKLKIADWREVVNEKQEELRYARVNTVKTGVEDAKRRLEELGAADVVLDNEISSLLQFRGRQDLHQSALIVDKLIFLQDKASCFPAAVLDPPAGAAVIDACAAPGNKTTHLACLMQNRGKILAFEKDKKRFETMNRLLLNTNLDIIRTINQDFLTTNPSSAEFSNVEYILVDPSCSGSGMHHRSENSEDSLERLQKLSNFQKKILNHSMKFPKTKRVVYSTCSIHEKENEMVVEDVLKENPEFILEEIFPQWPMRGKDRYENGKKMIRSDSSVGTIGFFVALFKRI